MPAGPAARALLAALAVAAGVTALASLAAPAASAGASGPRSGMVVAIVTGVARGIGPPDAADISDLGPGARTAPATDRAG